MSLVLKIQVTSLTCFRVRTPEEVHAVLSSELQLTFAALKQHPKVYWIWNHRRWCLQNTPDGPGTEDTGDPTTDKYAWKRANWARELAVVDKMLDADARNCEFVTPELLR